MPPNVALFICFAGIAGLFYLDRDNTVRTSKALWLPEVWLLLVGSRPVSAWFGIQPDAGVDVQMDGSPVDRFVFLLMLAAGIIVLAGRSIRTRSFLEANWPVVAYFVFCLMSVAWSDFPAISFKRWTKAVGDLVMVLILVTDANPLWGIRRFLSRAGYVLLPMSVVLIKYFGNLGRGYDPGGGQMNTGVTTNKNMLGVITLVLALGALWRFLTLLLDKRASNRGRHLLAQGTLLAFAVTVLVMAQSTTSEGCFAFGALILLATHTRTFRRHPGALHAVVITVILIGGIALLGGGRRAVAGALGKTENFSDRTEIWAAVLRVAPNAAIGAGFESFWLGPRLARVYSYSGLSQYEHVNEAHNGYIEMYLNLGWTGVALTTMILIRGYTSTVAAFRRDPEIGSLIITYVVAAAIYNITEAGFRLLDPIWVFLLLAVVTGGGIAARAGNRATEPLMDVVRADETLTMDSWAYINSEAIPEALRRAHGDLRI